MGFADNLRNTRLSAGLTQQQVADQMGITKSTYCGYETGKRQPDVQKIKQISQILGVPSDVLLETETPPTPGGGGLRKNSMYDLLNQENRAMVDALIEKLLKSQFDD